MAVLAYPKAAARTPSRKAALKPAAKPAERRPPSGDLINTILQYADLQQPMGGGRVMLSLSARRIADPVISGPLGREAGRLHEVAVIWDEREDEIFRIIDEARGAEPPAVLSADIDEAAAEDGAFELTPAALAYLARYADRR